jgi:hypothetical protein
VKLVEQKCPSNVQEKIAMQQQKEKKPLGEGAARACEEARGPVCHCRCQGKLHGSKRGGQHYGEQADGTFLDTPRAFFEVLPEDDPHYVLSAQAKKKRADAYREAKRKEHLEAMARRYEKLAEMESTAPRSLFW